MPRRFDLNLITTFDALWRERNVTRAAARLNISQPAVSNALMRMRDVFKDELFIRTPNGIQPTERCVEIASELELALHHVDRSMSPRHDFDPLVTQRTFHIAAMEYFDHVILPELLPQIAEHAPNVDIKISLVRADDGFEDLDLGIQDLCFGAAFEAPKRIDFAAAVSDPFVLLMREGHPNAGESMDLETFAGLHFAALAPRKTMTTEIDKLLLQRGLQRRLAMVTDTMASIFGAVLETDMVAVAPKLLAEKYQDYANFKIMDVPLDCHPAVFSLFWSRRSNTDPGAMWLKDRVLDVCRNLMAKADCRPA